MSKKIDIFVYTAFSAGKPINYYNTRVEVRKWQDTETVCAIMYLHERIIARRELVSGKVFICDGNYRLSQTTKARLNAIPRVHLSTKDGAHYLNGELWDGYWTEIKPA